MGVDLSRRILCIIVASTFLLVPLMGLAMAGPDEGPGSAAPPESRAAGDWPMFKLNVEGNPVTTSPGPGFGEDVEYWSNSTANSVYASPVIADGRLFIGSTNGKLYALDADTGEELWNNQTGPGSDYGVSSTACVANGYVIVLSNGDDDLYSFNVSTGERRWRADLGSASFGGSSPVVYNNKVYVGSPNGRLYVRNENDGSTAWDFPIGASGSNGYGVESSPAVSDNMVFFGGGDDYFRAVNISTQALEWQYPLNERGYPSPAVVNGVVYAGDGRYSGSTCAACAVYAWDVDGFDDGNQGFQGEASTGATDGDVLWSNNQMGMVVSSPTVYGDYVFVGSYDNTFYALNRSTGALEWSYQTSGDIAGTPAVSDGIVYVGSFDKKLYAFDVDGFTDGNDGWTGETSTGNADGDIIFNFTLGSNPWSSPAISNGLLYIAELNNKVWAIGTPTVDNNPPTIVSTDPVDLETDVPLGKTITIVVNEELIPGSVTAATVTLEDSGSNPVSGAVSFNAPSKTITFDPNADLAAHEEYTGSVGAIEDLSNNIRTSPHTWTFTTVNQAPTLDQGQVSPATGNTSTVFEFSVVFTDLDNDAPSTNITLHIDGDVVGDPMSPNTSASANLMDGDFTNGESYVYSTTIATGGDHTFNFNGTDGFDFHVSADFNGPHVDTPNMPPVIAAVPDQYVTEDVTVVFDMSPYISDPDNGLDELTMNATSPFLSFIVDFNATLVFTESAAGQEDITFTVSDGSNQAQGSVSFKVTKVDDPPVLSSLPDVTVDEGVDHVIHLFDFIEDVDTYFLDLSSATNSSYITIEHLNLTLNYTSDVTTELVNVSVADLTTTVYGEFTVTVRPSVVLNQAPVIETLMDATPTEDEPSTYDLEEYISDDGLPSDLLTVTEDSEYISVSGFVLNMLYPDGLTGEKVEITVSDGERSATADLIVVVTPVNDPPTLKSDGAIREKAEGASSDVSWRFGVTYTDIDSPDPTVELVLNGKSYPMHSTGTGDHVTGLLFQTTLSEKDIGPGTHTYKFKADDGSGASNALVETGGSSFKVEKKSGPVGPNSLEGLMFPIILIVIIAVTVLVVTLVMLRRRGPGPAPPPRQGPAQPDLISAPPQGQSPMEQPPSQQQLPPQQPSPPPPDYSQPPQPPQTN